MARDMVAKPSPPMLGPRAAPPHVWRFVVSSVAAVLSFLLLGALFINASHKDGAEQAEAAYRIVIETGTPLERCQAAGKVVDAHLDRLDAQAYEEWTWVRKADCHDAGF
jgi:hypothetical protein